MEQNTAYQYKALNEDSFNRLAAFVVNTTATVTLHRNLNTIVIAGDTANEVGQYIDSEGLDFNINPIEVHDENFGEVVDNPTTDAGTLRKIIYRLLQEKSDMSSAHKSAIEELSQTAEKTKKDKALYQKLYYDCSKDANRVKEQVQAIAVLFNNIFPKD